MFAIGLLNCSASKLVRVDRLVFIQRVIPGFQLPFIFRYYLITVPSNFDLSLAF
jgi:hypothetical protein